MAAEKFKMSQERYDKLKEELRYMETVRQKEVAEQLKEARSFGDLSENSEYDEAKIEQGKLYSKIEEIKNLLEEKFRQSEDFMHKENVKVYRNVQAALVEELKKQTEELKSSQPSGNGPRALIPISVLILIGVAADIVLQVLSMMNFKFF